MARPYAYMILIESPWGEAKQSWGNIQSDTFKGMLEAMQESNHNNDIWVKQYRRLESQTEIKTK